MKHTLLFSTPSRRTTRDTIGARGFTLIELMVVLAVAAIVSAITLGGFKEMREGNKRVSCQTNLSQIYQAARLYAADEGGKLPYYRDACDGSAPVGIGLWSLYTFPKSRASADFSTIAPVDSAPIQRYLRSAKSLHCPADDLDADEQLYTDATKTAFNPNYLSYQVCDNGGETPANPPAGISTYTSVRTTTTSDTGWERQLLHFDNTTFVSRQPTGDTIVAYCIFHRHQSNMDNVLFYDGSVQSIPKLQDTTTLQACYSAGPTCVSGWLRKPKPPQ